MLPSVWLLVLYFVLGQTAEQFNEKEKDAYYKWFGLNRRDFKKDELATQYRQLARKYHPDKNKEAGAEEKFYKISKAFDVLNDDNKRARYDRFGVEGVEEGGAAEHAGFAHDIFNSMFSDMFNVHDMFGGGGGGGGGRKGPASKTELRVSLETLFMGGNIKIEYNRIKSCDKCSGTGAHDPKDVKTCPKCRGQGAYIAVHQIAPGFVQQVQRECESCGGRGRTFSKTCGKCAGKRVHRADETVVVEIPAGASDQGMFRFDGMADENPDRAAGDLIVALQREEHPLYARDGIHLYCDLVITLKQALLGFKLTIPQLDGKPLEVSRTEITQNDLVVRIKGAGMPVVGGKGRGDLFVKFKVLLPLKLGQEQRKALERLLPGPIDSGHTKDVTHDHDEL